MKSPSEIALLRRAGAAAARGLIEAMRCTRPGVMEYQLDAALRYHYLAAGARDVAYRSIVAGGPNSWYGHYNANDCALRDGDLLLLDTGPEVRYYTSDITRMWPVNGTYTPVQRQLYGFIVEYHKVLLGVIRAGRTEMEIREEAARVMRPVVERTRFPKEIYAQAARRTLDFAHLTHSVGLSVHDVGTYKTGKPIPSRRCLRSGPPAHHSGGEALHQSRGYGRRHGNGSGEPHGPRAAGLVGDRARHARAGTAAGSAAGGLTLCHSLQDDAVVLEQLSLEANAVGKVEDSLSLPQTQGTHHALVFSPLCFLEREREVAAKERPAVVARSAEAASEYVVKRAVHLLDVSFVRHHHRPNRRGPLCHGNGRQSGQDWRCPPGMEASPLSSHLRGSVIDIISRI